MFLVPSILLGLTLITTPAGPAQSSGVLTSVHTISVKPTIVAAPDKVSVPSAALVVEDALRWALSDVGIQVGDAPVSAYVLLDEFTGGSAAKRALIGFGSGRSRLRARLVVKDDLGRELASIPIETRGRVLFSAYHSDATQQRRALDGFVKKLVAALTGMRGTRT